MGGQTSASSEMSYPPNPFRQSVTVENSSRNKSLENIADTLPGKFKATKSPPILPSIKPCEEDWEALAPPHELTSTININSLTASLPQPQLSNDASVAKPVQTRSISFINYELDSFSSNIVEVIQQRFESIDLDCDGKIRADDIVRFISRGSGVLSQTELDQRLDYVRLLIPEIAGRHQDYWTLKDFKKFMIKEDPLQPSPLLLALSRASRSTINQCKAK